MLLKILLRLWPVIAPLLVYFIWIWLNRAIIWIINYRKNRTVKTDYIVGEKSTTDNFNQNSKPKDFTRRGITISLYVGGALGIISLVISGISVSNDQSESEIITSQNDYQNDNW